MGLRLCLLDEDGYILRQVSSRSKSERVKPGFNEQQKRVLKALERVLDACEREKISLVGYSDSLCTFDGARLISSAKIIFEKIGPFLVLNSPVF